MTTSEAVTVTRTFMARPERVFQAFESPAELARWMVQPGSTTEVQELDVRVGGPIAVQMSWENGMSIRLRGTFRKVEKPSLLEFTWEMEGDDTNKGVVTVQLQPQGTGTELTLTHAGLAGPAKTYSEQGWNGWFDGLQAVVEAA